MQWREPQLLIADDDGDFRETLSEVFRRRGYRTLLVADGCEALEVIRSTTELHLVMLDVHMPRLTGLQTLQEIRRLPPPQLPCILMSALLNETIVEQARQLNTTSLLSKPFTLGTLTGTVDDVLRRWYGWSF